MTDRKFPLTEMQIAVLKDALFIASLMRKFGVNYNQITSVIGTSLEEQLKNALEYSEVGSP